MSENQHDEKRQFVRMRIETIVHYTLLGQSDPVYYGTCHDLSATGLYMTAEQTIEVGTEIEVIMNSEGKILPPFVAHGVVKRCTADDEDPNINHISIELTETN